MRGKYGEIIAALKSADPRIFVFAVLIFIAAMLVACVRLRLIAKVQSIHLTFPEAASLTYVGYFFNNFLPTAIGGDVVKAYYLSKKCENNTGSYTSVFIDRALGLITMIFMAFIALFFVQAEVVSNSIKYAVYIITGISVLAIIFLLNKTIAKFFSRLLSFVGPLENQLRKAYNAIHSYKHHTALMSQAFIASVIGQLMLFSCMGILALSIGSRISPIAVLIRMPVVSMVSLLPSINGLGVREGSTVFVFTPLIGESNAFAISILMIAIMLINSIIGGLIYLFSPHFKVKLKEIERERAQL